MARKFYIQVTLPKKVAERYGNREICSIIEHKIEGLDVNIKVEECRPQEETGLGDMYVRYADPT